MPDQMQFEIFGIQLIVDRLFEYTGGDDLNEDI